MTTDPRYRFNPLCRNRDFSGMFVSNPNAELPEPETFKPIDWLSEDLSGSGAERTYTDLELDLMVQELAQKGYCQ